MTPADAQTQTQKKAAAKKVAAKKYGPVPISMAPPPRARITVTRRSYLDAGTHVIPGDRKFTDYAIPPTYYPGSVVDNRGGMYIDQSALPGPFTCRAATILGPGISASAADERRLNRHAATRP